MEQQLVDQQLEQQSQIALLIAQGREQGYLILSEVHDHLPEELVDAEQIEDIIQMITDMGIQVFEVLEAGHHEELQELFTSYCREIAILIYNLQSLVRLEKGTIGGGISSQPLLLEEINHQYKSLMEESGEQRFSLVEIQAARYHNSSNLLGAVCHFNILENH